ncbi:DNA-directed DNA polymerase POL5 [Aspergillus saccharolyticus JOP 1030-1]|uniref:DNA polymerase V n=1 Tax=Aspergillus saccharolyticus JOP 1030-1 TaxID=1450539 RepID=A0A318ZIB3_9EURO|nr:hypothetical protein BP01DRAFT_357931 [Aspergillus saccharolyticus JOP 1030-1]PYH44313.1 hypothetical protein BP01DRAFT_357931 [Aspergillus saccharolyticus JOP 1030-1]
MAPHANHPNPTPASASASKKRRREPFNVDIKQVEIYEDLASEKDEIRLKAASALVSQFTPDKNPSEEQITKVLGRLFRGLCSSRKAARVGFSIALTEVLAQVFGNGTAAAAGGVAGVLDVWERLSNAVGGESGQEQRDHHFGRLFGAEAIIKSGVLFQSAPPMHKEWTRLLDLVFELAKKKPWLREECGWVVSSAVQQLQKLQANNSAAAKCVEVALERLCAHELAKTPEGVAVWVLAKEAFPHARFPGKVWKHDDPLDARERNSLAKVMKDSSDGKVEEAGEALPEKKKGAASSGVWNSKLHFAWELVLSRLPVGQESKSKGASRLGFSEFWGDVVDNGLFAAASSEERKYWGFSLFIKVVTETPLPGAAQVFTRNLIRCLMNQLAVEDRYLHRMAVKAAKSLQTRVAREPAFAAAAVRGLLSPSTGSVTFDQATKTKTVEKIVVEADVTALTEIVPLFEKLIASPCAADDTKAAASSRQYLAGLLLAIVRARAPAEDDAQAVLEQILFVLVRFAYFKGDAGSTSVSPPLSEQTQELFRNRIGSCINSLIANARYASVPSAVVRKIRDSAQSEAHGKFIVNMDAMIDEAVKNAFKSLKKLASMEKQDNAASVDAFRLLYSLTILQVYNGDADAASMLEELDFCYTKIFGAAEKKTKKDKKKDKKTTAEDHEDEETSAADALVEILLSFASKQSPLFRRMSEQVFGAFADSITENGLESLTAILEAKESLAGQQEMFDQQDEEGDAEMMDVDVDVDEEDSDVEVVEAGDDDEEDEEEEEESDEEDDEESSGDDDEEAIFEAKLAAALGTHRADADVGEADTSDDDADMNDDEMEELDEQLVKVFRARRDALGQKKDKKDARENMVHFKNRVLDLLEIYVKKCHAKLLALDLLLPLLRLTRRSTNKQISTKAGHVLREFTKQCKGSTGLPTIREDEDEESREAVWALLQSIHAEAAHSGPPAHAAACSQASLLVVKVLVAQNREHVARVVDVYSETRKMQLLSRKCHVPPSFFTDWNNWCVSFGKQKN